MKKVNYGRTFKIAVVILGVIILSALLILFNSIRVSYLKKKAYNVNTVTVEQIKHSIDSKAKKLMIVAHPDDEILWGGGHLMSGDYLVVCVTNGRNKKRSQEFKNVIKESGNNFLILEYPDKIAGEKDDWRNVWDKIYSDLEKIIKMKNWEEIVVHNTEGEYGHLHHKNLHFMVTDIYDKYNIKCPLYCFGKYYKNKNIDLYKDKLVPLSDKEYKFKKKLAEMYVSQQKTIQKLWHMSRYEMWTQYERNSEKHNVLPYMQKKPEFPKNNKKPYTSKDRSKVVNA